MPRVTTKRKCCRKAERCDRCPVLLMRLEREGWACCECRSRKGTTYAVSKKVPKAVLKSARRD